MEETEAWIPASETESLQVISFSNQSVSKTAFYTVILPTPIILASNKSQVNLSSELFSIFEYVFTAINPKKKKKKQVGFREGHYICYGRGDKKFTALKVP
jgi:hypothetical protein